MTSLRQQIGQMLILGFSGTVIDEQSPVANWLSNESLGGVLLFDYDLRTNQPGKNLINQAQIKNLTSQLKSHAQVSAFSRAEGLEPFIAIDYEGGAVDRLKEIEGCFKTQKPSELSRLTDKDLQLELTKMAEMLQDLGFNLNFAPLVDLNLNEEQGIIGKLGRSFSAEPNQVARAASIFVEVFAAHGLSCSYKHFPGHGSAVGDTHQGFVDTTETFQSKELEPYSLLIPKSELPVMIMTAHVINRQLDESGLPATLSHLMLTGLLREELGFEGLIISDDLQMQAISNHYTIDDALRLTINAGADMMIFANQLGDISASELIDRIEALVQKNRIEKRRIEQAYRRIIELKRKQLNFVKQKSLELN
ncbi:MAG: glycoside hydrolase family 3 protein [Tatlockia sp.]|nr:glycoside hydrolase family 3 protein [Tatlockia sp.]